MKRYWWGLLVLSILGLAGHGQAVLAQEEADRTVLSQFRRAEALAVDPKDRLYVVDARRHVVSVLDRSGARQYTIGGLGSRSGEFDEPVDVDPTNGQTVWVADAENGRLQRFSEEAQYLEALPVGESLTERQPRRTFDDGRDGRATRGDGRPVAVASTSEGAVFAINGRTDAVLKWDDQRRPERVLGGGEWGDAALRQPVALVLDGTRRLYVADHEQQAVFAFDLFGTFIERLATPSLPQLQALTMHRGRLWIVCADRVFVWHPEQGMMAEHGVDLPAPLVDAARRGEDLFLLTRTTLYRRTAW